MSHPAATLQPRHQWLQEIEVDNAEALAGLPLEDQEQLGG